LFVIYLYFAPFAQPTRRDGTLLTVAQRTIAEKIVDGGADYILSVKGNRGGLEEEVHTTCKQNRPVFDVTEVEKRHGCAIGE
jgi:predicted transposase YbfD/YdcC